MIRPILEYGDVIYNSCSLSTGQLIESIQRQAAIICTGGYRHTSYSSLLEELNWMSLANRRKLHKLILFYKIYNNIYPQYLHNFIIYNHNITHNLRHRHNIIPRDTRLSLTSCSFFPSTTRDWNNLSDTHRSAPTVLSFKRLTINKLTSTLRYSHLNNPYVRLTSGRTGTLLARLRMGLSALNAHRYRYNFIPYSTCTFCNTGAETTIHYFFTCTSHTLARTMFYNRLQQELELDTNPSQHLLETILYGRHINPTCYTTLLDIVYQYLRLTRRFN